MFQELDTPPSRCCWRCGCAIVSLITADIDQAFEACSSSAVLPAWRRISQSHESRFSSNSILVSRGRRELCKPGSSQSFGRGWLSFTTPVLAPTLFSLTSVSLVMLGSMVWQIRSIPIGGVMSSAAVAVVLGAVELGWLGQQEEHFRLGFHFRWACSPQLHLMEEICDDVLVGSRVFCDSCIFVFMRACYPVPLSLVSGAGTTVHRCGIARRWAARCGQHEEPQPAMGARSWSTRKVDFPFLDGVIKGGLCSIRGVVLGHLSRTKMLGLPEQLGVARLLDDAVELVYMGYPLSVIQGLVRSLPCSRVAQIGRKTVRTWISLCGNRMVLYYEMDPKQKPQPRR